MSNPVKWTTAYVSRLCPQLLKCEADIVLEECRIRTSSDGEIYPDLVITVAKSLFPEVLSNRSSVLPKQKIGSLEIAMNAIDIARKCLKQIPNEMKSDGTARAELELGAQWHYLMNELKEMKDGTGEYPGVNRATVTDISSAVKTKRGDNQDVH